MRKFLKGFYFAAAGIFACLKSERNMRIHFCAAFYVLIFMRFCELTRAEKALIFITIAAVISAEALNTAIEAAVDMISPERQPLAKLAKDAAAGAVLVLAIAAAAVGIVLLGNFGAICKAGAWFAAHKICAALLVLSAAAWTAFIISPAKRTEITDFTDNITDKEK
jgi:diacylglycerol kinase